MIGVLSFLPGWLYIRFIGQRAGAVWDEYVLNLHRLGLDEPQHLPQPPVNSEYFRPWYEGGGPTLSRHSNIYRQKFDAYYGRSVSLSGQDSRVKNGDAVPHRARHGRLRRRLDRAAVEQGLRRGSGDDFEVLGFGFLGAYLFDVQMLGAAVLPERPEAERIHQRGAARGRRVDHRRW